jgi:hypothetical protein
LSCELSPWAFIVCRNSPESGGEGLDRASTGIRQEFRRQLWRWRASLCPFRTSLSPFSLSLSVNGVPLTQAPAPQLLSVPHDPPQGESLETLWRPRPSRTRGLRVRGSHRPLATGWWRAGPWPANPGAGCYPDCGCWRSVALGDCCTPRNSPPAEEPLISTSSWTSECQGGIRFLW